MLKIFKHITKESGSKRFSDRGVYETVVLGLLLAGIATMMTVAGSVGQKISGHVRVKNAKNDLAAIGTLSGLGMQYYVATGSAPTINNLVSAGYLPNTSAVCSSCNGGQGAYVTPAGTNVTLGSPTAPGAMIGVNVRVPQSQSPVATMYKNALSGSNMTAGTGGTYQISWNNPISGSLSGKYVQLNPPGNASQTVTGNLDVPSITHSANGANGWISTQNLSTGAINTNGQPINLAGGQLQYAGFGWGTWVSTLCNGWQQIGALVSNWFNEGSCGFDSYGAMYVTGPSSCVPPSGFSLSFAC